MRLPRLVLSLAAALVPGLLVLGCTSSNDSPPGASATAPAVGLPGNAPPSSGVNRGAQLDFTQAASATGEAGTVTVAVQLVLPGGLTALPADATVVVVVTGGSATRGADYTDPGAVQLTFPAGTVSPAVRTVAITIATDALVEGDETIELGLVPVAAAVLGAHTRHVVTIQDAATATAAFATTASAIGEGGGAVTVGVVLHTGGATLTASRAFDVSRSGGSASEGADFRGVGTLRFTFPAGAGQGASQTFDVTILQDGVVESSESIELSLAVAGQTTPLDVHTISIQDDDLAFGGATVAFASAGSAVGEGAGTHAVSVTLAVVPAGASLPADLTVDVVQVLTPGQAAVATRPADFTGAPVTLTFPGGTGSGALSVTLVLADDALVEGQETLSLRLQNVSALGVLGAQTTHVVTFADDEAVPPSVLDTLAGSGVVGFADGAAAGARFTIPSHVAADAAGAIYVADRNNNRVRKIQGGVVTTIAGGAVGGFLDATPATAGRLLGPYGVAVDAMGNVFVADYLNQRVRRIDALTSALTTIAGDGTAGFLDATPATAGRLNDPVAVAVDPAGNVLVADYSGHRVRRIDALTSALTTIAGDGTAGFLDATPATSGRVNAPAGLAVDSAGNVFVGDYFNDRVRRIDLVTGGITTFAGSALGGYLDATPATAGRLEDPVGVALDASGNLFEVDGLFTQPRIRRVDAVTTALTTVAGDGTAAYLDATPATAGRLSIPYGVTVAPGGSLAIADTSDHHVRRVYRHDPLRVLTTSLAFAPLNAACSRPLRAQGGDAGVNGAFGWSVVSGALPAGVALVGGTPAASLTGTPTAAGTFTFVVQVTDPAGFAATRTLELVVAAPGIATTGGTGNGGFLNDGALATTATIDGPTGLAFDPDGHLFVGDAGNRRVRRIDASTGLIMTIAGTGATGFNGDSIAAAAANLDLPAGVAVDPLVNVYVADAGQDRVRRIDGLTGVITTIVGPADVTAPGDVALDAAGNLYVADTGNHRVRRVAVNTGLVTTIAGTGAPGYNNDGIAATLAQLSSPSGVAVDAAGNLFVVDRGNERVRRIDRVTGLISTVAGTGTAGVAGDGGPAAAAQLNAPRDAAFDPSGNLYVTDEGSHGLRRLDAASGFLSTPGGTLGSSGFGGDAGPAAAALLSAPFGVAVDPRSGRVAVADSGNRRLRTIGS